MIKIEIATEKDLSRILEIEKGSISPIWPEGALLVEINKEGSYFVVAVDESASHIVGYAVLRQVGYDGELQQIAVDESARRSGVGDLMMDAVLKHADIKSFESVFLEVRYRNTAAVRLYEKHGFRTVRVRKNYYENPVEDALVMSRGRGIFK